MEHLSLRDNRFYVHDYLGFKQHQSSYRPPSLPTPEPSRSSLEANESIYSLAPMQDDMVKDGPSSLQPGQQKAHYESRRRAAPESPPYEVVDESKPYLPPLKTILGEPMSSPPRTPLTRSAHPQPAPREPVYTSDTYKPPSLYPNKKQKTEVLTPVPPFAPVSFATPRTAILESPVKTSLPTDVSYSTIQSQYKPAMTRRPSNHRPHPLYRARSPLSEHQSTPRTLYDTTPASAPLPPSAHQYTTPESMPLSARSVQPAFYDSIEKEPHSSNARRFSSSAFEGLQRYPQEEPRGRTDSHFNNSQFNSPTMNDHSQHDGSRQFSRVEREPLAQRHEVNQGRLLPNRPLDNFATGRYECYYTKSRKRSNLPKHSTEIMRAWFDQNITNPYPSEDQKALFATATGISLTQVSNWFINHRRRCPELREKRVERRKP